MNPLNHQQFRIVFVGPPRVGKTSLLTSMYDVMDKEVHELGWKMTADAETRGFLNKCRKDIEDLARGPEIISQVMGIVGTSVVRDFTFFFKDKGGLEVSIRFTDVPGGVYDQPQNYPDPEKGYPKAQERLKEAKLFIIVVDAVALMERPAKRGSGTGHWHNSINMPDAVYEAYKADMSEADGHHVMFVLCKAETYLAKKGGREKMMHATKGGYSKLLDLVGDNDIPTYWCAVETTGVLHLSRIIENGGIATAEYLRHTTNEFQPRDCELPLRYALKVMTEQAVEDAKNNHENIDVWWRRALEGCGIPTDLEKAKAEVEKFMALLKEITGKIDGKKLIKL
jgi:hypothetical protein